MPKRARSISVRALGSKRHQSDVVELYPRPRTRAECELGLRPCPYVGCKYNLYLDVNRKNGTIKLNFPDLEPDEMVVSCVLDVANEGGTTLEVVGACFNLTRERIRQIEARAVMRLKRMCDELREYHEGSVEIRHILDVLRDDAPF
jgi:hypothetical protein